MLEHIEIYVYWLCYTGMFPVGDTSSGTLIAVCVRVCVCVCVCALRVRVRMRVRACARAGGRACVRAGGRAGVRACMCVCVRRHIAMLRQE